MIKNTLKATALTLGSVFSMASLAGGPVDLDLQATVTSTAGSTFDVRIDWFATGQPNSCIWILYQWTGSWSSIDSGSVHWAGSEIVTLPDADYMLFVMCEGNGEGGEYVDAETVYFGD
ncbi:MAG: hypothetical protein Q8L60_05330 [Gammaproteobacteria bacterium]|nr:hypothetical protein [Gammaproteobacteria bacterium]MDP2140112.1 hypothetical protein [Gammaproteobacteria bacterium]MDP2346330.1 hypothetical protein [Gammaproteobacteria bacterium]